LPGRWHCQGIAKLKFGQFNLTIIKECTFKLDGGAMFGVVPKTLWSKETPCDQLNRVELACNLLLIETAHGKVLIETGMGARWSDKEKDRYDLVRLVDANNPLAGCGTSCDDIDYVIISHLHFDHAGGATKLVDGNLVPTFPKAKYVIQKGEWEFAHNANARARASYRLEDFDPLSTFGCLQLVEGDFEVLPGIKVAVTGGHTSHHQMVTFASQGETGVYFADIIPTKEHLSPPWVMGYDHFPLVSCDVKTTWLKRAYEANWLVVFDHEVDIPWGRLALSQGDKYAFKAMDRRTLD
jgi:glyoxylase-like metal-dependent hydrolase (beta-lactamase superfamily II)